MVQLSFLKGLANLTVSHRVGLIRQALKHWALSLLLKNRRSLLYAVSAMIGWLDV